ncbi:DUF2073 domain-containing protein [Candidatus Woesearchaeota archaeon]|nr:DUF2073 domain-containing protein [Candidatus Woesearchaeota archaeon]
MLTLQYVPHHEFVQLSMDEKINKILRAVRDGKILLIEGRLNPLEESELIKKTMEVITKDFKGVEIASIDYEPFNKSLFDKLKKDLGNFLLKRRPGITIVGPATIVKEIRKDPSKIELLTMEKKKKK